MTPTLTDYLIAFLVPFAFPALGIGSVLAGMASSIRRRGRATGNDIALIIALILAGAVLTVLSVMMSAGANYD